MKKEKDDIEIQRFKEEILLSENNIVTLGENEKTFGDFVEFCEIVDFFASRYGLGACKSIEEFAGMIDNTDPALLKTLQVVAYESEKRKWSMDDKKGSVGKKAKNNASNVNGSVQTSVPIQSPDKIINSNRDVFKSFLLRSGVDKNELDIAMEDLNKRKIKLKDFSWVAEGSTLETMDNEQFKKTLAEMSDQNRKSKKFKISIETISKAKW